MNNRVAQESLSFSLIDIGHSSAQPGKKLQNPVLMVRKGNHGRRLSKDAKGR